MSFIDYEFCLSLCKIAALYIPIYFILRFSHLAKQFPKTSISMAHVWGISFFIHTFIVCYVYIMYHATTDSFFLMQAVANTTPAETHNYWQHTLQHQFDWLIASILLILLFLWLNHRYSNKLLQEKKRFAQYPITLKIIIGSLIFIVLFALIARPVRSFHPWVFWPTWYSNMTQLKAEHINFAASKQQIEQTTSVLKPHTQLKKNTLMLVIEESINRDNMSIYGYARNTTPYLKTIPQLNIYTNVYSAEATTVPAINHLLTGMEYPETQVNWKKHYHVLALAKKAGYKIIWINNQNDPILSQRYVSFADEIIQVHRARTNTSKALDDDVLDHIRHATQDSAPLKFIIVHLMGAHPSYENHFTEQETQLFSTPDTVTQQMQQQGRSNAIIAARNNYDRAIKRQDYILYEIFTRFHNGLPKNTPASWLMVSDHGQEVGHTLNFAGHNPRSINGYKVPLLLWSNTFAPTSTEQYVRTDLLDYDLLTLLTINHRMSNATHTTMLTNEHTEPLKISPWLAPPAK